MLYIRSRGAVLVHSPVPLWSQCVTAVPFPSLCRRFVRAPRHRSTDSSPLPRSLLPCLGLHLSPLAPLLPPQIPAHRAQPRPNPTFLELKSHTEAEISHRDIPHSPATVKSAPTVLCLLRRKWIIFGLLRGNARPRGNGLCAPRPPGHQRRGSGLRVFGERH